MELEALIICAFKGRIQNLGQSFSSVIFWFWSPYSYSSLLARVVGAGVLGGCVCV